MEWLVCVFLLGVMRLGDCGAVPYPPAAQNYVELQALRRGREIIKTPLVHNQRAECLAGSVWSTNCHTCKCSDNGLAECTLLETCEKAIAPSMKCAPDTTWKNACNTCLCTPNGVPMCTKIGCIMGPIISLDAINPKTSSADEIQKSSKNATHKVVCVANRMFIKDCNTCWCNEDGTSFFCTRKVCVPELPDDAANVEDKTEDLDILKKECRPNEVFEIDCNMCRCNSDGKSFSCTRRVCVEPVDEDPKNVTLKRERRLASDKEAPKACQPGQEFRMDCNKCLCDNEGKNFSCTRYDCAAINNHYSKNGGSRKRRDVSEQLPTKCEAGSVFNKDCNICRCSLDGQEATCTEKSCNEHKENNEGNAPGKNKVSESDPSFRCNPGEQFKRGCSDCSCSADGKSIFCTVRLCDQDVTPPPSR